LISRVLVQCLLLRSSHLYLNQRPAKTTIRSREGSGVAQHRNRRARTLIPATRSPELRAIERYVGRVPSAHCLTTSLSTPAASCRCRSMTAKSASY